MNRTAFRAWPKFFKLTHYTFDGALDIVKTMEENEASGIKITVVRVVDTVIRQFITK